MHRALNTCFAGLALLGSTLLLAGPHSAAAKEDFARARAFRETTAGKVIRDQVTPIWTADGNRFWYRNRLRNGPDEFVVVDVEKGTRTVVPKAPSLDAGLPVLPDRRHPPASPSSDEDTQITFVNKTGGEVQTHWIDWDGHRKRYGTLQPGEESGQHTFVGHVWLATDARGRPLAAFEAAEGGGRAVIEERPAPQRRDGPDRPREADSPDRRYDVFVRDQNVFLRNRQTGEESRLSSTSSAGDAFQERAYWSPDSTRVVVLSTQPGDDRKICLVKSSPDNQVQPEVEWVPYPKPGDRIPISRPHLFDVASRREIPVDSALFPNPWSISDLRWAPDSSRFSFLYNQRGHQVLRILSVDAASGAVRAIVDERSPTFFDYAGKLFVRYLDATQEILWMSERDGWNHLYLYDAKSGAVRNQITRGEWVVREIERVDEEKRQVWFFAGGIRPGQDPYYLHLCRVNFDGSGLAVLTEGDGTHKVQFSPDRRFFLDTWSRVDLPPITELRRSDTGALVCELEKADWSALLETGWRVPERFVAKGRDGTTDIYGVIWRPVSFDQNGKYPVVESIYAGPHDSFVPKKFAAFHSDQQIAELGFIVVKIDGMGTSNRSKKFHDVCWKNLGDAGLPDRVLWIKAAAQKVPQMDLSRVGIFGGSAGGQSAMRALLMYPDFYKVGVADCGCHDNRMDKIWWNELWMGWPVGPHYAEQSNVTQAHRLQGKLMLIVGELDHNVDPASTLQVANALVKADKDFELVVIPGAGHGTAETPYGWRRRAEFLTRNLLGSANP